MNKKNSSSNHNKEKKFIQEIEKKEKRKLKARKNKDRAIWMGFGLFGVIGWSVMIPTIIGVAIGIWIDSRWPSRISWTLTLLFIGIIIGCLNAWYWVQKERQTIEEEREEQYYSYVSGLNLVRVFIRFILFWRIMDDS